MCTLLIVPYGGDLTATAQTNGCLQWNCLSYLRMGSKSIIFIQQHELVTSATAKTNWASLNSRLLMITRKMLSFNQASFAVKMHHAGQGVAERLYALWWWRIEIARFHLKMYLLRQHKSSTFTWRSQMNHHHGTIDMHELPPKGSI